MSSGNVLPAVGAGRKVLERGGLLCAEVLELEQLREQCDLIWAHELLQGVAFHMDSVSLQPNGSDILPLGQAEPAAGSRDSLQLLARRIHTAIDSQAAAISELSTPRTVQSERAQLKQMEQQLETQLHNANESRLRAEQQLTILMSAADHHRPVQNVAFGSLQGGQLDVREMTLVDCLGRVLTQVCHCYRQHPSCST